MLVYQQIIPVTEITQVGEARRCANRLADEAGCSESDRGKAAIVATELATNLAKYSKQGEIHLRSSYGPSGRWLETWSIDRGPGMNHVDQCLADGYSSGGTPGNGLGAVKRLSTEFDIHSLQPSGTVVYSRICETNHQRPAARLSWGVVSRPAPHEERCGDSWTLAEHAEQFAIMMVDGLGHGPNAADAANVAVQTFDDEPFAPIPMFYQRADARMRSTRGGAIATARVDLNRNVLTYAGIGNIAGQLRAADSPTGRGLVSHNGTVGLQMYRVQEFQYDCPVGSLLIMSSDGLQTRWSFDAYPGLQRRHPAVIAAVLYRDFTRGKDDVTVAAVRFSSNGATV